MCLVRRNAGKPIGPFDHQKLLELFSQGKFDLATDEISRDNGGSWEPLENAFKATAAPRRRLRSYEYTIIGVVLFCVATATMALVMHFLDNLERIRKDMPVSRINELNEVEKIQVEEYKKLYREFNDSWDLSEGMLNVFNASKDEETKQELGKWYIIYRQRAEKAQTKMQQLWLELDLQRRDFDLIDEEAKKIPRSEEFVKAFAKLEEMKLGRTK